MAGTYEEVQRKVELERMLELYNVSEEYSRYSVVCPPPVNVPHLSYELIRFLLKRKDIKDHWPNCPWYRQLDLYLSRNSDTFQYREFQHLDVRGASPEQEQEKEVATATSAEGGGDTRKDDKTGGSGSCSDIISLLVGRWGGGRVNGNGKDGHDKEEQVQDIDKTQQVSR